MYPVLCLYIQMQLLVNYYTDTNFITITPFGCMATVLQWTACWMLHHVLQHMVMGTLSREKDQYNFLGFIFKSGNPTQHSEMCNKKPINYLVHISECNQSRCGAVPMLGYIWDDFFFCSGVGGNSSFCTCQFEVCLHFYSFLMLSPHQEWCVVWGPVNLSLVVI